ncbi:SGNH/GDSL hydrolase family protein [Microcoleus sp. F10-C6]|uniref:SGNH/GDSL hydrolase family protein n=1 Tax=unclassified Microcoleus TaxID=2642155 RepID=UPI002FD22177
MTKLKRWLQNLLLVFGGVFFAVLIVEIGLRLIGMTYPRFDTFDEHRGWAYRPGFSDWYQSEGKAYLQINSEGFRDREHSKTKPENTFRIAVLGDSFVAAQEVPLEQTFLNVMERKLCKDEAFSGKKVEVINFGVRGYGTAQELITLREKVWQYAPDLVLLAFFTDNDVTNNYQFPEFKAFFRPYFIFQDDKLVFDGSFVNSDAYRSRLSWWTLAYDTIRDNSRVVQIMFKIINYYSEQLKQQRVLTEGRETSLVDKVYKEPADTNWQEAWQVTEELIRLMRNEVVEKGANFLVVTLSNPIQVHPEPSIRQKFMEDLGISDLFYPDWRINALAEREGFTVLNLAPSFQTYAEKNKLCLHGFDNFVPCFGHWNALGHQLAGKIIGQKISEEQIKREISSTNNY